jgi:hypothetical protein
VTEKASYANGDDEHGDNAEADDSSQSAVEKPRHANASWKRAGRRTPHEIALSFRCSSRGGISAMRLLAIGLAVALIVFVLTSGHVIFLPLLFLPFGLFSFGRRRRQQTGFLTGRRSDGFR